jgi:hypothetical protein
LRTRIKSERARLIQKALAHPDRPARDEADKPEVAAAGDDSADSDSGVSNLTFQIDMQKARAAGRRLMLLDAAHSAADWQRDLYINMLQRGLDPRWMRAGDCGCGQYGSGN